MHLHPPTTRLHIDRRLSHGDIEILVALEDGLRYFIGLPTGVIPTGPHVFIEVSRETVLDLEHGAATLHAVIQHGSIGRIFELDAATLKSISGYATATRREARDPALPE